MEASITGAGLVLAVYALIIPMSGRIFKELNKEIQDNLIEFDKLKDKITPESKKEMKKLNKLRGNIENLKLLPVRLGFGVLITFGLYCLSVIVGAFELITPFNYSVDYMPIIFISATVLFLGVGVFAIVMVLMPMINEFEAIAKRQKKVSSKTV